MMTKFIKLATLFVATVLTLFNLTAQRDRTDANIIGHVVNAKTNEHLPGIIVRIKNTSIGMSTDESGHYAFRDLNPGMATIVVRGLGYKTEEKTVKVERDKTLEVNFELQEDEFQLDEVVVSANREETLRRVAPSLVSVLDHKLFSKTNASNLFQSLPFQPGVRVENDCQNCGFNQVRINGLDGRYSQILIDSRPVMSALAGVYGVEQIPTNMIDRVEVVRGGGSALYGSSAIAGVINILTKEPNCNSFSFSENLSMTGMKSVDNNFNLNASIVAPNNSIGGMIYGVSRHRNPWDKNGDGFSELGKLDSRSLGGHFFVRPSMNSRLTAEIHTIQEDRRGGDNMDWPDHVAQISEHVRHYIYSGNTKYDLFSYNRKHHLQAYLAGQVIRRESYYGGVAYHDEKWGTVGNPVPATSYGDNYGITKGRTYNLGMQYTYDMDKFIFMPAQFLFGSEYTYDKLVDRMPIRQWETADNSSAKNPISKFPGVNQRINIWSQFAQVEWKNDMFSLLLGGRLDENSLLSNPIFSPRATLRFNPVKSVNFRLTYAKGFRAPQVFDEDLHVAVVNGEAKKVRNEKNLKPEVSHSVSLSADTYFNLGEARCNFMVEGFGTIVRDVFSTDNDHKFDNVQDGIKHMVRVNGPGAKVFGVNVEGRLVWDWISLQAGMTYNHARYDAPTSFGERTLVRDGSKDVMPKTAPVMKDGVEPNFAKDGDGNYNNEEVTDNRYQRTPSMYGYFTLSLSPISRLSVDLSGTFTGSMYVPHAIEWGASSAISDRNLIDAGLRKEGVVDASGNAPHWDELVKTPRFFDMGLKVSYKFRLFNTSDLKVYVGMSNVFNSFQKDFDLGAGRDSAYIYGPGQPRTGYLGIQLFL